MHADFAALPRSESVHKTTISRHEKSCVVMPLPHDLNTHTFMHMCNTSEKKIVPRNFTGMHTHIYAHAYAQTYMRSSWKFRPRCVCHERVECIHAYTHTWMYVYVCEENTQFVHTQVILYT
jgi:hypothetical protein